MQQLSNVAVLLLRTEIELFCNRDTESVSEQKLLKNKTRKVAIGRGDDCVCVCM